MTDTKNVEYHVEETVYQVSEERPGVTDTDWYEYRVRLVNSHGDVIDSWDSYHETYNGFQKLSETRAREARDRQRRSRRRVCGLTFRSQGVRCGHRNTYYTGCCVV